MELLDLNLNILTIGFIFSFFIFVILLIVQIVKKDAGWVDVGWTSCLGLVVIALAIAGEGNIFRRVLVSSFLGFWSIRLVSYIIKDRLLKNHEDSRYENLRNHWGSKANKRFFLFFTLQSFLVILFSIPFLPIFNLEKPINIFDIFGILLWLIAISGEILADQQLSNFRNNPNNNLKVCRTGLWKYSRHPNFFFEWLQWVAFTFFCIGSEYYMISLVGPLFMYIFLMKISGIPWIEKQALKKRGAEYKKYQDEVPQFFPKLKLF